MQRYTDDELTALLRDTESDLVERKESWTGDAPTKGREAICAFANDLPGHRKPGVLIRVTWMNDRVELTSPGGPFGSVTIENFGTPGIADYRNPSLAEAMRVLGFVQRFGVGIPTARRALRDNGNPELEYHVEQNWVHCRIGRCK